MLTDREAWKVGFLERCASAGLTPEQILHTVKQAQAELEKSALVQEALNAAKWVGDQAFGYGIPLALAAPPVVGGLGGYALAKATDIDDTDVAEVKNKELVDEYKLQADKLRRQNAVRALYEREETWSDLLMIGELK